MNYLNSINRVDDPASFALRIGLTRSRNMYAVLGYGDVTPCASGYTAAAPNDRVFGAGTLVDVAALKFWYSGAASASDAYAKAFDAIAAEYEDRLPKATTAERTSAIRVALLDRKILDFVRGLELAAGQPSTTHSCAGYQMAAGGAQKIRELLESRLGVDVVVASSLLRPRFSWPGKLAGIDFISARGTVKPFSLGPSGLYYSGLGRYQQAKHCVLYTSAALCDFASAWYAELGSDRQALLVDTDSGGEAWVPENATFAYDDRQPGACDTLLTLAAGCKDLSAAFVSPDCVLSGEEPAHDFLLRIIVTDILDAVAVTPRAELLLRSEKLSATLRAAVRAQLSGNVPAQVLMEFDSVAPTRSLFVNGKHTYLADADGYLKTQGDSETRLSNFVLNFEAAAMFGESREVLMLGYATMRDRRFPVAITTEDLDTPSKLSRAIAAEEIKAGARGSLPLLYSFSDMRPVCLHLKHKVEHLPIIDGVSSLGWNGINTIFTTPGFSVTKQGTHYRDAAAHPGPKELEAFSFKTGSAPEDLRAEVFSRDTWRLAAFAAGSIAARALGYRPATLCVKNSGNARTSIQTAFRGLGQVEPIGVGSNARTGRVDYINGFPVWVVSGDGEGLDTLPYSAITLRPSGLELEDVDARAAELLSYVVAHTAAFILDGGIVPATKALLSGEYILRVGVSVLQALGFAHMVGLEESQLPKTEQLFSKDERVRYDYDITKNLVALQLTEEAVEELLQAFPQSEARGATIVMHSLPAFELIKNWYGSLY